MGREHYADLAARPFFPGLVSYMNSGPVVAMAWEGQGAVKTGRVMLGETNPAASKPGTIRGDYCIQVGRNICHGSDAVESAEHEIKLWFRGRHLQLYPCPGRLGPWKQLDGAWRSVALLWSSSSLWLHKNICAFSTKIHCVTLLKAFRIV